MSHLLVLFLSSALAILVISSGARWISSKRPARAIPAGSGPASKSSENRAMLFAQLRALASIAFAVVLFLALLRASIAFTGQVGLPLALTAGLSASGGLLLYSSLPAPMPPRTGAANASLVPRKPWSFGPRRSFLVPAAIAVCYIGLLVATGLTSSPDELGRYRLIRLAEGAHSTSAGPYPGWFYGVPLMLVTVALAGAAFLALRRISSTPSLPDPRMAALDMQWREISTRVVVRLGTGALLGYAGGTALLAGQAVAGAAANFNQSGHGPLQPLFAVGFAVAVAGPVLVAAGAFLIFLAAKAAFTIRSSARHALAKPADQAPTSQGAGA